MVNSNSFLPPFFLCLGNPPSGVTDRSVYRDGGEGWTYTSEYFRGFLSRGCGTVIPEVKVRVLLMNNRGFE